jgi:hypothetical protein
MTHPMLDAATIRMLDGPRLAHLACMLGLAPAGCLPGDAWAPHLDVAQAEGVLRTLRAQGWHTTVHADPWGTGTVIVSTGLPYVGPWQAQAFGRPGEPTEAHALVLVAVLAIAASQEAL